MKALLQIYFILFSFCILSAQEKVIHYNTINGLPHDIAYGIFQDRDGFIWIGTDDGLVKFDGQEFKLFSTDDGLRNNFVIDINQNNKGDIVVATWGGGLHVIRNDRVLKIKITNDDNEKINNLQIWNNNIIAKHTRGNILYQETKNGYVKSLVTKDNRQLRVSNYNKIVSGKYYITVIDNIPFLLNDIKTFYHNDTTTDYGIFRLDKNKLVSLYPRFDNRIVNSISKTEQNAYAITILDSVFILKNHQLEKYRLQFDDDKKIICKIQKISNDEYLVLTSDKKGFKDVYLFSDHFRVKINLKHVLKTQSSVSGFLVDNERNIWITTNGDGVFCYNKNIAPFQTITGKLPEKLIIDINEINKTKYFLSPNYLTSYDGNRMGKIKLSGIGKKLTAIDSANLVVSSLNIEQGMRYKNIEEKLAFNVIHLESRKNIFVNDSIYVEYYNRKIPTIKKNVNDAIFYRDTLWFATNLGMYYFLKDSQNLIKKTVGSKKLPSEHIRKFICRSDILWIATNKGLCRVRNNKITYYTRKQGLISNRINTMMEDHTGKLWIGTNRGLSVFDGKNFINITTSRGLLSPFINAIYENSDNEIMIGSDKGVTIINNNQSLKLESPPLIHIKKLGDAFQFTAISFNRSNSLLVEYQLNNSDWLTLNMPKGTIDFSKEKKGNYTLQFRAKKQDGIWGYSPKYKFSITIPWYKDFTYIVICISIVCILIVLITIDQLQKVKRRNLTLKEAITRQQHLEEELSEVRSNIAQDFHDELGNKLARISLISNMALTEVSPENPKLMRQIQQIENDTNSLYKGTKDFIFSLKDNSNDLEELVTYLSDFGEDLFANTSIKFLVQKDIESGQSLPHYWSKQLIYIFKEALTNAMKHSECSTILFKFVYSKQTLTISCEDDGIGIVGDEGKRFGNGIFNMKKRAQKLGGSLTIDHRENKWTRIAFVGKTTL